MTSALALYHVICHVPSVSAPSERGMRSYPNDPDAFENIMQAHVSQHLLLQFGQLSGRQAVWATGIMAVDISAMSIQQSADPLRPMWSYLRTSSADGCIQLPSHVCPPGRLALHVLFGYHVSLQVLNQYPKPCAERGSLTWA